MKNNHKILIVFFAILIFLLTVITTSAEVKLVNNNAVSIEQYSFSNCQCMPTVYEFKVENTGNLIETYTFSVESFSKKHYFINKPMMILQPGKSSTVKVTVILPCTEVGFYEGAFVSKTRTSKIRSKTYFYLTTTECFDYTAALRAYEPVIVNNTVTGKKLNDVEDVLEICAQENTTAVIQFNNQEPYVNYYNLDFTELEWITMENNTVSVPADSIEIFDITLSPAPEDVGRYNFSLHITPVLGTQEQDKNITIDVAECYKYSAELISYDKICTNPTKYNITVANQGQFKEKIELMVDEPSWAKIAPNMTEIESGNSTVFELSLTPPDETGNATIIINSSLVDRNISRQHELYLDLISLQDCYQVDFVDRKSKAYYGYNTPKFRIRNIGHEWASYKLLSISGIGEWVDLMTDAVELGADEKGVFFITTNATKDIPRGSYPFDIHIETATGQEYSETLTIKLTEKGLFLNKIKGFIDSIRMKIFPTQEERLFYHKWKMNKQYEIDLSTLFYDPDFDSLTFNVTETKNINVEIEDTNLILTPLQGWTGTEIIQITVDDGQGGVTTTPNITLVVS